VAENNKLNSTEEVTMLDFLKENFPKEKSDSQKKSPRSRGMKLHLSQKKKVQSETSGNSNEHPNPPKIKTPKSPRRIFAKNPAKEKDTTLKKDTTAEKKRDKNSEKTETISAKWTDSFETENIFRRSSGKISRRIFFIFGNYLLYP